VVCAAADEAAQAVKPDTAFLMTSMLQDVIDGGTAWKARQLGFRLPAAGKTGTTNEYRDAWFVGYTKALVTGVWVGYDTPKPILPGSAYAADVAVPLWARFMVVATEGDPVQPFRAPRGIVTAQICRLSGKRPAGGCEAVPVILDTGGHEERSMVTTEYFAAGTQPEDSCHLHVGRSLFGRLAGWLSGPQGEVTARRASVDEDDEPVVKPSAPAAPEVPAVAQAPEPEKKRGFWSRLFGRRDRNEAAKPKPAEKKRPR
jgi:penicillin-binding protein 1A